MKRFGWHWVGMVAAWLTLGVTGAGGQLTTHDPAALVIFPKVIVDSSWETTIQLSNTANRPAYALCHYVNGAPTFPDLPVGPGNPPQWAELDFSIILDRQQPTQWVASRGRLADPTDSVCPSPLASCDGTGIDPGVIPPVATGFTGELICVEVDASGAPWSGNALTGHATLTHLGSGEVVKYPGIGAIGLDTNDADQTLCLGGEPQDGCSRGGEYAPCASEWDISHPAEFDDRLVDGDSSRTTLTIVPCGQNFETQEPTQIVVSMLVLNEFENAFSASTTVDCWADLRLADFPIFDRDTLGSRWVHTRLRTVAGTPLGFAVVQQSISEAGKLPLFAATATVPPQREGAVRPDRIVLPGQQVGQ